MEGEFPRATILIVDDTPENLRVLGELLRDRYNVRVANSGERALQVVASPPRPDLILLDIMMPGMDGYECLRHLRANPETRDIPIIFVTALDGAEDEQRGLELGAADYLTKPVRPAILHARVRNHLDLKRARDYLRDQNAFLESQLDRFLVVLAHHLQEPVRRQFTFAQMLRRSLTAPLNDIAVTSLEEIMDGATRLRAMLNDILHYLSIHQTPAIPTLCSAEEIFDEVCRESQPRILATGAEVTRGALPTLWLDHEQLTVVFRALLENALEYRRPDRPSHIRMSAETQGTEVIFSLTDNGLGVAPEYRDRLFQVFERLHADRARVGTGIGLALVRKIVEALHGRVWIEDGEEGGARFCMALPSSVPPPDSSSPPFEGSPS